LLKDNRFKVLQAFIVQAVKSSNFSLSVNPVMNGQRILITGFMGSGKTTVARELSRQLNCEWADLDDLITKQEGQTPGEIIDQDGELKFRERETQALAKVLGTGSEQVIAAGGGAWTIADNRELITKHEALAVWLDAPFALCWRRIQSGGERPLARSRESAQQLYDARKPIYKTAAVRVVVDDRQTAEDVAKEIIAAVLRQQAHS
jgi:shikimate kinase